MDSLEALNRSLFLAINADPATAAWLLGLGKFLAKDTFYLLPALLIALWFKGQRPLAIKSVVVTIVSLALGVIAGLIWVHQRPFVLGIGHTYIDHKPTTSFPSHHATIFAAIGFTLLAAETRLLGLIVLVFGVLAGWARVYMGLHFPFDIIGGFVMAAAGYLVVSAFWEKYWKKINDKISKH
jgi:undecaprenyl-diphosphatase